MWTERSLVWFPVRVHAQAVTHVPVVGIREEIDRCSSHTWMYLCLSFSLPSLPSDENGKSLTFYAKGFKDSALIQDTLTAVRRKQGKRRFSECPHMPPGSFKWTVFSKMSWMQIANITKDAPDSPSYLKKLMNHNSANQNTETLIHPNLAKVPLSS